MALVFRTSKFLSCLICCTALQQHSKQDLMSVHGDTDSKLENNELEGHSSDFHDDLATVQVEVDALSGLITTFGKRHHAYGMSGLKLIKHSGRVKSPKNAVVTHICDNTWALGALALGASLRKFDPKAEVVVMITREVTPDYRSLLADVFDSVFMEEAITDHPSISRSGADCVTLQIRSWSLPYEKAMYMDSDMVMLSNPDFVFDLYGEMSAKVDDQARYGFNGGMFVLEPNPKTYAKLVRSVEKYPASKSSDGTMHGIQQFLNHMYPKCSEDLDLNEKAGCWRQELEPALNRITRDLTEKDVADIQQGNFAGAKSLHFSGDWGSDKKPWQEGCMVFSDSVTRSHNETFHKEVLGLWAREFHRIKVGPESEELLKLPCAALA